MAREKDLFIVLKGKPHSDARESEEVIEVDENTYAIARSIVSLTRSIEALISVMGRGK